MLQQPTAEGASAMQPDARSGDSDASAPGRTATGHLKRWSPLLVLAAATALGFGLGLHRLISFETVGMNYAHLIGFIDHHEVVSLTLFALGYIAVVALSLPCGLLLTVAGGLLFGPVVAVPVIVVAATAGATLVFLIARSSFGGDLAEKASPWVSRLSKGFQEDAFSYLLFLRLVPAFPFVVVNLAPALLGVPLRTYVLATALGIIPGTAAFAVAGAGFGSVFEAQNALFTECQAEAARQPGRMCHYGVDPTSFLTPGLAIGLASLGLVALIPVVAKQWRRRHAAR